MGRNPEEILEYTQWKNNSLSLKLRDLVFLELLLYVFRGIKTQGVSIDCVSEFVDRPSRDHIGTVYKCSEHKNWKLKGLMCRS